MSAVCYTIAVYCTVNVDPEDGQPDISGTELCRQIEKALKGNSYRHLDAAFDLELMETEEVPS